MRSTPTAHPGPGRAPAPGRNPRRRRDRIRARRRQQRPPGLHARPRRLGLHAAASTSWQQPGNPAPGPTRQREPQTTPAQKGRDPGSTDPVGTDVGAPRRPSRRGGLGPGGSGNTTRRPAPTPHETEGPPGTPAPSAPPPVPQPTPGPAPNRSTRTSAHSGDSAHSGSTPATPPRRRRGLTRRHPTAARCRHVGARQRHRVSAAHENHPLRMDERCELRPPATRRPNPTHQPRNALGRTHLLIQI